MLSPGVLKVTFIPTAEDAYLLLLLVIMTEEIQASGYVSHPETAVRRGQQTFFFCKGPNSDYFKLLGAKEVSVTYSSLPPHSPLASAPPPFFINTFPKLGKHLYLAHGLGWPRGVTC